MLFRLWQQTLARGGDAVALHRLDGREPTSFSCLQHRLDTLAPLPAGELHIIESSEGLEKFVLEVMRCWRDDAVCCPVESRVGLNFPQATELAPGLRHLKITSGTTGQPRWVAFRPAQLVADADNIRASMGLNPIFPNLAVVSAAHSYGFSNLILPLLLQGHPMVVAPDPMPGTLRRALSGPMRLTIPAVPALWRAWHQAGLLKTAQIALAISAGAPLPLELERQVFEDSGLKLHNFFGSSECGGIAYDPTTVPRADAGFAGFAMNGVRLCSGDDACLMVESVAVAEGYHGPTASACSARLGAGRFHTSDLVELQGDAVFLRGRVGDTINVAGRKLNPSEVEEVLLTCASVKHCVVFGVPSSDAVRCEEPVACVHADQSLTCEALTDWLATRLPAWQLPRRFWFCSELQPNDRCKISRQDWRQRYLGLTLG